MDVLDKTGVGLLWSICKTKFALTGHTHTLSQIKDAGAAASKSVKTANGATSADWVGPAVNNNIVPTMTFIAYWNGAYNSDGNSNLQYCNKGKFGALAVKDTADWSLITNKPSTATRWPSWGEVTGKPSSFTPSSHTHDDRYYTQSQINSQLAARAVNITLATNADLNKVNAPGFYNCGSGNNILNKPSGVDAIGLIVTHNASGSYYTQILTTSSNKDTYRRTCLNGTWSAWTQDKYTDTNTWRGIQNNLTSNSTSDSLSAAQGKVLKGLIDSKANSSNLSSYAQKSQAIASIDIVDNYYNDQKHIRPRFYIQKADGDESTLDIEDASTKKSGLMSCYDKSKLDGIQAGANKYTLPVASSTALGGIKVTTKATGTQWPICVDNNGIAYAHINGLSQSYDNSIGSLLVVDSDDHSAKYGYNGIDVGMSDSASHHIDFPSKSGTFALTSDCLSSEKGSVYPCNANGFSINFTSAQQIVLLDTSGNYDISDWYNFSSIGNVLDMYPCGLMGGNLSSEHKGLLKVMKTTQGGPKLTSIDSFGLQYNIHVRLIHIDNGVLVCPYTLNY